MKISGLYFRLVASFVVVLLAAIVFMSVLLWTGKLRPPITRHAEERAEAISNLVQRELMGADAITPELEARLYTVLEAFASAVNGWAWITAPDGAVVARSFHGAMPLDGREEVDQEFVTEGGDTLRLLHRGDHLNFYMEGSVRLGGEPLVVHLLHAWRPKKLEEWLLKWLVVMSVVAAVILLPVSRRLTRPLKQLTESAQLVAKGDFSPRVQSAKLGELSLLADSFNHMAESLDRMIKGSRELTANLSHELRSPLARLRMSQQIIEERMAAGRTDGVEKHLGKMEDEINHMDGLIDKILALSKLDLQEPAPKSDMVNLGALLVETIARHQPLATARSIVINHEPTSLPAYTCNQEDVQIVLDNVLSNAIKYSPADACIEIAAQIDGDTISIRFTNPYPKLADEELDTIFVPFKRLGYDEVDGNGLGLAFARKIVEDHGGTMNATSDEGGFHMTVIFPC